MDELLVEKIIESLMSNEVKKEYLDMYLNDYELKNHCDMMMSKYIKSRIFGDINISNKCINYLNNVIKPQLSVKPYLSNVNIIKRTIEEYLIKIYNEYYNVNKKDLKSNSYLEKMVYDTKYENATNLLSKIDTEFLFKNNNSLEAEERLANIYINRIKNNNNLSKEQVEELISFAISGGFVLKHEEYTNKAFDYALRTILNNNYKIDDYLYKMLFLNSCKSILNEKNINGVSIEFNNGDYEMSFSNAKKTIYVNEEELKNRTIIHNFMSFFHELRHYEQHNYMVDDILKDFLFQKEEYLFKELKKDEYYKDNYRNHFIEKDAHYASYKYLYDFIKEKAPSKISEAKKEIYSDLMITIYLSNNNIYERKKGKEIKDVNVLFEEVLRDKKQLLACSKDFVKSPLIIEYDILGRKRSIFELLEIKEIEEKTGLNSRCKIINYLLYEESVTMDYILENLQCFEDDEIKKKYSKYFREAKKIIKHKMIKYKADTLTDKKSKLDKNKNIAISMFYDLIIDKLRKKNIRGLNKDKNIKLYRSKEEELKIAYKWLYNLSKEIEEENGQKMLEEIFNKSK